MSRHEERFLAVYPRARVESHKGNGPGGKRYYLVRTSYDASMWSGWGDTKAAAWRDAASKLPVDTIPSGEVGPFAIKTI